MPAAFSPIVLDWVEACDPKQLVIVDSLVSYLEGSENDSAEIRQYMDGYRMLANRGASVLDSAKDSSAKDYRGSSDIKGSVDVAYNQASGTSTPASMTVDTSAPTTFDIRGSMAAETKTLPHFAVEVLPAVA